MSQNSAINDKDEINISDDENPQPNPPNDGPQNDDPQNDDPQNANPQPNPDPIQFQQYGIDMETHLRNRTPWNQISHGFTTGVFHSDTNIPSLALRGGAIKHGKIQGATKIPAWQCQCASGSSTNPLKRKNWHPYSVMQCPECETNRPIDSDINYSQFTDKLAYPTIITAEYESRDTESKQQNDDDLKDNEDDGDDIDGPQNDNNNDEDGDEDDDDDKQKSKDDDDNDDAKIEIKSKSKRADAKFIKVTIEPKSKRDNNNINPNYNNDNDDDYDDVGDFDIPIDEDPDNPINIGTNVLRSWGLEEYAPRLRELGWLDNEPDEWIKLKEDYLKSNVGMTIQDADTFIKNAKKWFNDHVYVQQK